MVGARVFRVDAFQTGGISPNEGRMHVGADVDRPFHVWVVMCGCFGTG